MEGGGEFLRLGIGQVWVVEDGQGVYFVADEVNLIFIAEFGVPNDHLLGIAFADRVMGVTEHDPCYFGRGRGCVRSGFLERFLHFLEFHVREHLRGG